MPVLVRRQTLEEQLSLIGAIKALQDGTPEQFPLRHAQNTINSLLRSTLSDTATIVKRRTVAPCSRECDTLLSGELATLRGQLYTHEAGVLASLHALTYEHARGQLLSLRLQSGSPDAFFDHRLCAYLQTVMLARRANREACTEDEAAAATSLLAVVQGRAGELPSIRHLLLAVGNGSCEALLPDPLVALVLKRGRYRDKLTRELERLRRNRRWFDAYKLVSGLRDVSDLPRAYLMLHELLPGFPMWVAWEPNLRRIMSWESKRLDPYRQKIAPILDLEGPDTTGQQRGTLRISSPGAFRTMTTPASSNDRDFLDRLLDDLDTCLRVGPRAIELLIYICVDRHGVSRSSLDLVEAVLELQDDDAAGILLNLVLALAADCATNSRMLAFILALPLLQKHQHLQRTYGTYGDLARAVSTTLSTAQRELFRESQSPELSACFILQVQALGDAMQRASWLHPQWLPEYVDMLRLIPSEMEVREVYPGLATCFPWDSPDDNRLAARIGPLIMRLAGQTTNADDVLCRRYDCCVGLLADAAACLVSIPGKEGKGVVVQL